MKKSMTKIMKGAIALAMTIGMGVGAGTSSRKAEPVCATEGTITYTFTSKSWTATAAGSAANWTSGKDAGGFSNNGIQVTNNVKYTGANGTSPISFNDVSRVVLTYNTNQSAGEGTAVVQIGTNDEVSQNWGYSGTADGRTANFTLTYNFSPVQNGNVKITLNTTVNSIYLVSCAITASNVGPSVTGVSLTGNMTDTSYTTVQSWSHTGLTPTVTMSDSSAYSSDIDWSYSPTTPAAAVIANSGNEVTGLSVTATASAGGKSASKATSGIAVNYANVAQGLAATPASGTLQNVIVKGIVSRVTGVYQSGKAVYYISDDGTTSNELEVYNGKYLNNTNFTSESQIQAGDIVVVYGGLTTHNTTKEFGDGAYLLSKESTNPAIEITTAPFSICVGDSDVVVQKTAENIPAGGSVKWISSATSVATIDESTGELHAVAAGSTEITAKIVDSGDTLRASDSIMVHVIEPISENGSFVKVTKSLDLIGGGKYLINYGNGKVFNGSLGNLDSISNGIDVEITNDSIAKNNNTKGAYFTLEIVDGNKYLKSASGYYIGRTENTNGLNVSTTRTDDYINTFTFNGDGEAVIASSSGPSLRYNSASNQLRFRYYKDAAQQPISIYKFVPSGSQLINAESIASIRGSESAGEVTAVSLGFGAKIAVSDWTAINSSNTITDYGVMFAKEDSLTARSRVSIEDSFIGGETLANVHKNSGAAPYQSGDYYIFTVLANVVDELGNLDSSQYGTVFCAAPYIVAGGNYYFFAEMRYSVNTLAAYCLANGGSNLSDAALSTLVP